MDRKEAQRITVEVLKKEIAKNGEDGVYVESPVRGPRQRWTFKDALEAAEKDVELPDSFGINPVSDMISFIDYCNERGRDWKDIFYSDSEE